MSVTAKFVIKQPGGVAIPISLQPGEYTIGRSERCRIRLRSQEVSEQHAVLRITERGTTISDCGSSNGTWTYGGRIASEIHVSNGQEIIIGPYVLIAESIMSVAPVPAVDQMLQSAPAEPIHSEAVPSVTENCQPTPARPQPSTDTVSPQISGEESEGVLTQSQIVRREIKSQIHRELVQRLDLKRLSASRASGEELTKRARETLDSIIGEIRARLPRDVEPNELADEIFNEAMRLGPLEEFLSDDTITEIMVNGPHKVYVERKGRLVLTGKTFIDDASVLAVIERIVSPIGRRIDESQPYVDARLADGSRVNAIIAPLSLIGPCITIRKFSKVPLHAEDFVRFGTWTAEMAQFLKICVKMRKNIIVAGGTGSGKTTLLNVLSSFIPHTERIVTIEDAAELRLDQPHLVRLEARPPNIEGRGAITIRDLVRNALRMRPDRIIVGECRSGEALDMLQAMNTGHDGSLTTVHANSPRDVVSRLETMVLMSGLELPSRAIREQISSAVDLIVHESRFSDGSRRITAITEVLGLEGTQTVMQDIFTFKQTGVDENGKILGALEPTGSVPTFYEQIKAHGLTLDPVIFQPHDRQYGDVK